MPRYPIRPRSRQPRAHPEEQALIGTTLAHYRITAAIGSGGMGEVYRATDTKLGREVAPKVLPAGMAASADRLERFRREAKALAAETARSLQGDTLVLTHEGHSLARFAAGEAK